jgi:hypothetical protein
MSKIEGSHMSESKELEKRYASKLAGVADEMDSLRAIINSRNEVLAEKEVALSSMRSKLYNDYLVIRTLKDEKNFAEDKMNIILEENYRITKIVSDMAEINVTKAHHRTRSRRTWTLSSSRSTSSRSNNAPRTSRACRSARRNASARWSRSSPKRSTRPMRLSTFCRTLSELN